MATGVMIFKGMKVGVLPGDFTLREGEPGAVNRNLVLSTAYNVLPIWVRIARDNLVQAKKASEDIGKHWGDDEEKNKELLMLELKPAIQVFVACGIVLDALYDQLRPYAKITKADIEKWREKKRGEQTK